jgi:hypothetical protein
MLSWRGLADRTAGAGRFFILLLLNDGIVPGASSETTLDQQLVQLSQRRHRNARRTQRHPGAGDRIQHPGRHYDDHAGRDLDMNDLTAGAPLNVLAAYPTPIKRVPPVVNFNFLLDMSRPGDCSWPQKLAVRRQRRGRVMLLTSSCD